MRIALGALLVLVTLACVGICAVYGLAWYGRREIGAAAVANVENFLNSTVAIPAEMLDPQPFEAKVIAAAIALARENEILEDKWRDQNAIAGRAAHDRGDGHTEFEGMRSIAQRLSRGEKLSDAEWTSATAFLADSDALLSAARTLSRMPGYDLEVCFDSEMPFRAQPAKVISNAVLALRLSAYRAAKQGDYTAAASDEMSAIELARAKRRPALIAQLTQASILNVSSRDLMRFSEPLTSETVVVKFISILTSSEFSAPVVKLLPDSRTQTFVELIREYERAGVPIRLQYIDSGRDLFDLLVAATDLREQQRQGKSVRFSLSDFRARSGAFYIPPGRKMPALYSTWLLFRHSLYISDTLRIAFIGPMGVPNRLESEVRGKVSLVWIRLAAQALAERQRQLGGTPVLPTDIDKDPFSTGTLLVNSAGVRYSVGPDGADDKAAVQYDPRNATMSKGDIFAPGP